MQNAWADEDAKESEINNSLPALQITNPLALDSIDTSWNLRTNDDSLTTHHDQDPWADSENKFGGNNVGAGGEGQYGLGLDLEQVLQEVKAEATQNDSTYQYPASNITHSDASEPVQQLEQQDEDSSKLSVAVESSRLSTSKSTESLRKNSNPGRDSRKSPIFSPFAHRKSASAADSGPSPAYTPSKSQTISQIQSVFTDSQKIAYVGLCYLSIYTYRKTRLAPESSSKTISSSSPAVASFDKWSLKIMEKLYIYLDLSPAERTMIEQLAQHGLLPSDLSTSLLQDAEKARQEPDGTDIRYTTLSHLYLLAVSDGVYDARSRAMVRTLALNLEIPYQELVRLENCISQELRVYDEEGAVKHDETVIGERNTKEHKGRWMYAGLGVLAGGALIGVTAGLAAPFIGAGIGAALTTFGVSQGAVVGGFMASTGGIALITGGGVLTGGGMSGKAIVNRTRGIEEFEFLSLEEAMVKISIAREERRLKRLKTIKNEALLKEMELQKELNAHLHSDSNLSSVPISARTTSASKDGSLSASKGFNDPADLLWEAKSSMSTPDIIDDVHEGDAEKTLDVWADKGGNDDDDVLPPEESPDHESSTDDSFHQTHVLITVSGWVNYDQDDHTYPFSTLEPGMNGDQYTLIWETNALKELGSTMSILATEIASFIFQQGLQATLLPVLMGALTGPLWLMKLTYLVDNPWGNALSKAEKAGRLLADTLIGQVQNGRPVTLVGYSIGSRLIFYCLLELAAQGAYGIVESVYIFGTPCVASRKEWEAVMSVVSGKLYNFYNTNDTLLAVIYRTSITSFKDVPGLSPVEGIEGVENKDLTSVMNGHMDYSKKMPSILKDYGFEITSEDIIDQDAEEEAWKEEVEEEKKKSKEKKEKERQIQIEKLAQDKLADEQRRVEADAERKRLAKEAAIADRKRKELEAQMKEAALNRTGPVSSFAPPSMSLEEIAAEELHEMAEMEKIMMQYWEPREITSTLPPLQLVIDPATASDSALPPTEASGQLFEEGAGTDGVHTEEEALSDF